MAFRVSDLGPPATSPAFVAPSALRRIGLVALETDLTLEPDFARLTHGLGVTVFASRVPYDNPDTPDGLAALEGHLTAAAGRLVPGAAFDVVHFGCTSASAVIGDDGVARAVRAAKPGAAVTNPMTAADAALRALGVRRLSLLTPYLPAISQPVADRFESAGYTLDGLTCWGIRDDRDMARLDGDVIVREAVAATAPTADALFISCTAVPSAAVAARIEAAIGRPVVTSNQAAAWLALRLCGVTADVPDGGRLFACPLTPDWQRGAA
ncbi:ectoine utilization protein EutA [Roseospira goensis]|uniref:Maleate isomerase n=1 Tax=Roseospira goensis TaxID=391922 RepID=A0A7W6RWP1_9PROT|nr:ectoine utilization protein EutA [Roseospira goensis]MBB4284628.1 maleate isomerase [Roseospira goensis]